MKVNSLLKTIQVDVTSKTDINLLFISENKTLSLNQAKSVFSNSSLDLDDDIFLYTYNSISMDVKNFSNNVGMSCFKHFAAMR